MSRTAKCYFFAYSYMYINMHISLNKTLTTLKTYIHTAETNFEGTVSQNVDIGFSFCFMLCRRMDYLKIVQKNTKVTRFLP